MGLSRISRILRRFSDRPCGVNFVANGPVTKFVHSARIPRHAIWRQCCSQWAYHGIHAFRTHSVTGDSAQILWPMGMSRISRILRRFSDRPCGVNFVANGPVTEFVHSAQIPRRAIWWQFCSQWARHGIRAFRTHSVTGHSAQILWPAFTRPSLGLH